MCAGVCSCFTGGWLSSGAHRLFPAVDLQRWTQTTTTLQLLNDRGEHISQSINCSHFCELTSLKPSEQQGPKTLIMASLCRCHVTTLDEHSAGLSAHVTSKPDFNLSYSRIKKEVETHSWFCCPQSGLTQLWICCSLSPEYLTYTVGLLMLEVN